MQRKVIKNRTIMVEENEWNVFKKLAKLNDTDASKEIRKFIRKYIEENADKLNKLF